MQPPTVFIVDDDPSIRRVLRELFTQERMPAELFTSAREFLEAIDPRRPGCLLLDVRMPEISGLELQEQLAARGVNLPIVFMTAYADVPMTVRAMKRGAVDFVEKPFNDQLLLEAVQRALARDAEMRHAHTERRALEQRLKELTPRERQVFERVVQGRTNPEIAREWGISEKTVKIHRGRVMEKMQAKSLPELVLMGQKTGICTTNVV